MILKAKQKELGNFDPMCKVMGMQKSVELCSLISIQFRKMYDKRISSVSILSTISTITEKNNNNNSLAFKASDQDVSVVHMNVLLLLLEQVMHEVVVVEGNSVSVLLFEGSLFLFFYYYITTALWKHAAACKSGYAEVISMIATAIEVELLVQ
ncbi:hypothetical protein T07_11921 [Trichinella nelsoni]|uniref:Uncharacterized protein n=1 Tax=Trichinella nelsoni TaxID=6336 RepID=A0A0V0RV40_9BILA|nr:hypothetical protein T07_11921 [Trichinella nelsoni]